MTFVGENKTLRGARPIQRGQYHANCKRILTDGIRAEDDSPMRVWVRHMCESRVPHHLSERPYFVGKNKTLRGLGPSKEDNIMLIVSGSLQIVLEPRTPLL